MATLGVLRDRVFSDLGSDMMGLGEARPPFSGERVEQALFEGLQQHRKGVAWSELPIEEEQLVSLLAKAKLCCDKATELALHPNIRVGTNTDVDYAELSDLLRRMCEAYNDEYDEQFDRISSDPDSDIVVGQIVRRSLRTGMKTAHNAVRQPAKPIITSVGWLYNPATGGGKLNVQWQRLSDLDVAYMRLYLTRDPEFLFQGDSTVALRTIYDFAWFPGTIEPSIPSQMALIAHTFAETGPYWLVPLATNWNGLTRQGDPFKFNIAHRLTIAADEAVVQDSLGTTTTTTTSTTTTTTTAP